MNNKNMAISKKNKNDEFYTQLKDIEKELKHYKDFFKNKTIYLNCDDYKHSNFYKYFKLKFKFLGLKKLIATHYSNNKQCFKATIKNNIETITPLKTNGDFRSYECLELLKEADLIVTNPPFSLFREYVAQLIKYNKKDFIILGNKNAIVLKNIFPLIKNNLISWGHSKANNFLTPSGEITKNLNGLTRWYTNLKTLKREELFLYKEYDSVDYPKYDNSNIIHIDKTKNIPNNYYKEMGVPITFFDKYNAKQFKILSLRKFKIDGKALYIRMIIINAKQ